MATGARPLPEVKWHCSSCYDGPAFTCHAEDVEWEFDPELGNVGRGYRDLRPDQVSEMFLYKPYEAPGANGPVFNIAIHDDDGKPTEWVWNGFYRKDRTGKHYMIAFERPVGTQPFTVPERPIHYWDPRDNPEFEKLLREYEDIAKAQTPA